MKTEKLSLVGGISYAIGSIIGSGILFLPSLTFNLSGKNVFLSWTLATLLCVPLMIIFFDMSKTSPVEEGIKGYIESGLGKFLGLSFPILMLSTVSIGMPSSALIVGKYVREYFQFNGLEYLVAVYLVLFGIVTNLLGKSFGEKIQNVVSVIFFGVGIILFSLTLPDASRGYSKIVPDFNLPQTFSGITMAFWAFAGFENLTFIIKDFENPKRDFFISMLVALIVCGLLYLGVTANYAAIIPASEVQAVMGIYQLSQIVEPKAISGLVIVTLAIFALKTNFNSWIRGLSSMVKSSSNDGGLPRLFGQENNPVYLLGGLFSLTLILSYFFPSFLEIGLVIVSSNFVLIYVLCIISYLRTSKSWAKKLMASITLCILLLSLGTSGMKLLYPVLILGLCYLVHKFKSRSFLATSGILFFCLTSVVSASTQVINVALIFRYDDKYNGTTKSLDRGLELAKNVLEKEKGVKINLNRYSHDEKLQTVVEATQKAIKDGHYIIIGGENSDEALAIAETIKNKDIFFITPTSTNPRVTAGKPFVFRTCISDDKVADKLAQFVYEKLKPSSIGILHNVSYPYSDYLSRQFHQKTLELIDRSSSHQSQRMKVSVKKIIRNQQDYSEEIKFFKANGISHLVVLSFQSDLLRFYSQAVEAGLHPVYIGSDGWGFNEAVSNQIVKNNGDSFVGIRNVYWNGESSSKKNLKFKDDFKKRYASEANPWAAITYDTLTLVTNSFLSLKVQADAKTLRDAVKNFQSKDLLTSDNFFFDDSNTPGQEVILYKIEKKGIGFYGKI
jgi:amino acid efflux transporter